MTGFERVGVAGAGLMGGGIAQVCAAAGYPTVVRDVDQAVLDRARGAIRASLGKLAEKGKVPPDAPEAALSRLRFTTNLAALGEADLVIEAVPEDLDLKLALWGELDGRCPPRTVFATNTSSLSVGRMAEATARPDRFVGLHFFNPAPLMPLVEVVRAAATSDDTAARATAFVRSLGKEPVAATDTPGFIVNRLLVPYMMDAVRALEAGVASVPDLDLAMQLGAGHPMGPLTLLDVVGLDTACRAADVLHRELGDPRAEPPALLRRLVGAGRLGRKSGRGFYDYAGPEPVPAELP